MAENPWLSEHFSKAIFEGSADAILVADDQGRFVAANPAACALFGGDEGEILGRRFDDFAVPGSDVAKQWTALRTAGRLRDDFALLRADGTRRDVELTGLADVVPGLHVLTLRDVTEQKALEQARRLAEERLRIVIAHAPIILFATDRSGTYTLHEGKGVESLGLRPGELVGQSLFERRRDAPAVLDAARRALAGETSQTELAVGDSSFECTMLPVRDADGVQTGLAGVAIDTTARKRSEAALRASEARFRAMIENGLEGIWLLASDGTITFASTSSRAILGVEASALVGTRAIDWVVEEDRAYVDLEMKALRAEPALGRALEFRVRHHDGSDRWIEATGSNMLDHPAVGALVSNFRDITQRKMTEAAQREAQHFLEEAQAVAHVGSWVSGARLDLPITWSAECARIFGRDVADAPTAAEFMQLVHPDDRARVVEASRRAIATQTAAEVDHRILLPDGTLRWVRAKSLIDGPLDWDGERPRLGRDDRDPDEYRAVGIVQDITEQRAADEAGKRLASIVESSDDAIISRDRDGLIRTWNLAAERLTGYSAAEAIGQPIARFYPPELESRLDADRAAVDGGDTLRQYEMPLVRKDGTRVEVSLTSSTLLDEAGQPQGASIIARDMTEQRRTAATLRRTEEQLREAQKLEAVGALAGGIAHDFNNLLSVVLSYTSLILEDLRGDDPLRADIEEIKKAGERATTLTRQLLAFSRKQMLQPVVVEVNQIVQGVERLLERLLGEDVDLSIQTASDAGKVHVDPGQLEQVLMNLVVNARDAMPRGGHLTIETASVLLDERYVAEHPTVRPGPFVVIAVTDTGTGMDRATQERVFEPFFTTKERGKGTGLGLAMVYGIVQQSGGHVLLRSEVGVGTTFEIYLPQTDRAVAAPLATLPPPTEVRGSETILVVEDQEEVRRILRTVLRKHGYQVLEAQNGGEAFLVCEEFGAKIDLLLTDVVMPRMSGRQLAERLAKLRPDMKVLFVSGYTEDTIIQHGVLDSGIDFLAKPILPSVLLRKVRQVLDAVRPAARSGD